MARYLKNPDIIKGGKLAARLPIVPSSAYGDAPVDGLIRFNQTSSKVEFYYNGAWNQVAKIGTVQLVVDSDLIGDGTTTEFDMSQQETDSNAVAVFVGGVYQQPGINYIVSVYKIIFSSPPPAPVGVNQNKITIIHNLNSTDAA
jgi:hypothetical protein